MGVRGRGGQAFSGSSRRSSRRGPRQELGSSARSCTGAAAAAAAACREWEHVGQLPAHACEGRTRWVLHALEQPPSFTHSASPRSLRAGAVRRGWAGSGGEQRGRDSARQDGGGVARVLPRQVPAGGQGGARHRHPGECAGCEGAGWGLDRAPARASLGLAGFAPARAQFHMYPPHTRATTSSAQPSLPTRPRPCCPIPRAEPPHPRHQQRVQLPNHLAAEAAAAAVGHVCVLLLLRAQRDGVGQVAGLRQHQRGDRQPRCVAAVRRGCEHVPPCSTERPSLAPRPARTGQR